MRTRLLFFAWITAFLLVPFLLISGARAQEIQRPTFDAKDLEALCRTDWFGLYLQGKKIGYFRTAREQVGSEVRETSTFVMKLASFGKKTEVLNKQTMVFEGKAPYRFLQGEMVQRNDPTPPQKTVLTRNDKGFEVIYTTGGETIKKQIADPDYTLADSLAPDLWIRRGPKDGAMAVARTLDLTDQKIYKLTSKVLGSKTSLVGGIKVRYFEVENESSKEMLKFLTRHDDQGRTLSSNIAIFELRLESEEDAKNTEYSQDLFVLGMVKADKALGSTRKVTELVLRIDKDGDVFEDGPRQRVEAGPKGSKIVKLGKSHGVSAKASAKEIEDALSETNAYCISHPKVKAMAAQAVGDAKTPEEKVKRIVDFVHDFVKPTLSAAIPSIHDLMEKKTGDCKSYALLVTNLARASGVPAREVAGLLYVGDDQKAFGGHAWNEVVLNGVWVPIDATMRQTEVDATHISFGTEFKAAKNLLNSLGKLSFKVVEVKSAP